MKYECKCIPKHSLPHIVKTSAIKGHSFLGIWLFEHLSCAKSCDNHPVPLKRFEIWIKGRTLLIFGKIIH